jgi:hypothetical protein
VSEEDRRDERVVLREPEHRARGRFGAGEERRHHTAQLVLARGEQDAPAEGVDRRAADDGRTREQSVHHRQPAEVGRDGEHDRDVFDRVEQRVRCRHRVDPLGRP